MSSASPKVWSPTRGNGNRAPTESAFASATSLLIASARDGNSSRAAANRLLARDRLTVRDRMPGRA